MSENYIRAIEVGENEVPIKLNHMITTSNRGKPVYLKSNEGVFTVYDSDTEYLTVDPSGQTVGSGSTGHFFRAEGPAGGTISISSGGQVLMENSNRRVEVADDLITISNDSTYLEVGNTSISCNVDDDYFKMKPGEWELDHKYYYGSNKDTYASHIESLDGKFDVSLSCKYGAGASAGTTAKSHILMRPSQIYLESSGYFIDISPDGNEAIEIGAPNAYMVLSDSYASLNTNGGAHIDVRQNSVDVCAQYSNSAPHVKVDKSCAQFVGKYGDSLRGSDVEIKVRGLDGSDERSPTAYMAYDCYGNGIRTIHTYVSCGFQDTGIHYEEDNKCCRVDVGSDVNTITLYSSQNTSTGAEVYSASFAVNELDISASQRITINGAGLTELFEWEDGNQFNEDRIGKFVTLSGNLIRVASVDDEYILGIMDPNPYIVGDAPIEWPNKYITDVFGRIVYEDLFVEGELDDDGNEIVSGHFEKVPKLNPDYDETRKYIRRQHRPEYAAITSKGKVVMIDDGTCVPGKFATVGEGGIATYSDDNIAVRVLSRVDENHVRVYIDSVFMVKH